MKRGYYAKEVKLAVMLCLVEKKTGFFSVGLVQQYVSASHVHCYPPPPCLSMCVSVSHHLA